MPNEIRWILLILVIAAVIGLAVTIARPRRGGTTDKRDGRHSKREASAANPRRDRELRDLHAASADKSAYQQHAETEHPTVELTPPRKLPGQDRLTQNPGTGMDASSKTISAAADDHLSGAPPRLRSGDPTLAQGRPPATGGASPASSAGPSHPATTQMPYAGRVVPVPPAAPRAAPLAPTGPQPAPPAQRRAGIPLDPPRLPGETRADRRRRLELLSALEAQQRERGRNALRAAESSADPRPAPETPTDPS